MAVRVMNVNGIAYTVQVFGNEQPVDERPDYETIMSSFNVITDESTDSQPGPDAAHSKSLSEMLGSGTWMAMEIAFAIILLKLIFWRSTERKA